MWRTLFAAALVYGGGHPSFDGYRPALLDRPLQSFYQDVNTAARDGQKVIATLDDYRCIAISRATLPAWMRSCARPTKEQQHG